MSTPRRTRSRIFAVVTLLPLVALLVCWPLESEAQGEPPAPSEEPGTPQAGDQPDGFDEWSDDCKERWRELQRQHTRRGELEEEQGCVEAAGATSKAECREATTEKERLEKELEGIQEELRTWNTDTRTMRRGKSRAERRRIDRERRAEKKRKRARRDEIEDELPRVQARIDACNRACEANDARLEEIARELAKLPSNQEIEDAMLALIRDCGPQDPAVNGAGTQVTLAPPRPIGHVVGQTTWDEGCVELLWVQGTEPYFAPEAYSNPITRSAQRMGEELSSIWGQCCVRFRVYLKIKTLASFGGLASPTNGLFQGTDADGGSRMLAKAKADFPNDFPASIRAFADHPECAVFVVVDDVEGGDAGFATIGGGAPAGVIAADGEVLAHEVGHALGGIRHVQNGRAHGHGELMWGEGSPGHPTRRQGVPYTGLTAADCTAMRAATPDTTDLCEAGDGGQ